MVPERAQATELVWEGYYRARGLYLNSLSLADTTTNEHASGPTIYMDHRLSLRPSWLLSEHASLHAQLDVVPLTVWGDNTDTYTDPVTGDTVARADATGVAASGPQLSAARAWGEVHTSVGHFAVGRMPMEWGAGLLWNPGNDPLDEYGDTADRVQYSNIFGPVSVMAAFDVQYEGFLNDTDDMQSLSLALAYRGETAGAGLLSSFRYQGASGDSTSGWQEYTGDVWGFSELGPLTVNLEAIGKFGGGDQPDIGGNDLTEMAFGGMLDAKLQKDKLGVGVEGGFATGDADTGDSKLHTFTFNRDHNVGLFLFEESMPTLAAGVATQTNGGVDTSVAQSGDGVSNAIYLKPSASYLVRPDLRAQLSWLTATKAKPTAETADRKGYGNEFDLDLRYDPVPHVWVQGTAAIFVPGKVYSEYSSDTLGDGFGKTVFGARLVGTVEF